MPITLSPKTQMLIEEQMKKSGFSSPDDLIRFVLETLQTPGEDLEDLDAETLAAIEKAEAQSARGEGIPVHEAFEQVRRKHFGS